MRTIPTYFVVLVIIICFVSCEDDSVLPPPPDQNPPIAPSNLEGEAISTTEIRLAWNDRAENEQGYEVHESVSDQSDFQLVHDTEEININTVTLTSKTPGTTYHYKVRGYNQGGMGEYSNIISVSTPDEPPAAPTNLVAEAASSSQINLNWDDNSGNEDGFKIERKTSGGVWGEIGEVGEGAKVYSDSDLQPSTTYYYRVFAYNSGNVSGFSNEANANTSDPPQESPDPPSGLTATAVSETQIDLAWDDNSSNEEGFRIQRRFEGGTFGNLATVGAAIETYSDTNLEPATKYYYQVRAFNSAGESTFSNEASATTPSPSIPEKPTGLNAEANSQTQITITWLDNSKNESGFKLECKTDGDFAEIVRTTANDTMYQHTNLVQNTTYTYRIRAFNDIGNSDYSNTISEKTLELGELPAPSGLRAEPNSDSQIDLTWNYDVLDHEGFRIQKKEEGGNYSQLTQIDDVNMRTYRHTGLSQNTTYYYKILAFRDTEESPLSNETSATTFGVPESPTNPNANPRSPSEIRLTWIDNADNEDNYRIERHTSSNSYEFLTEIPANNGTGSMAFIDSGLQPETQYFYQITAANGYGDSESIEANATTPAGPQPPAAPTNLNGNALSTSEISLTWTDNADDETSFEIKRKTENGAYYTIETLGVNTGIGGMTHIDSDGLEANTLYYYQVFAINTNGQSPSNETSVRTEDYPPPEAPSALSVTAVSYTEIELEWQDNADDEDNYYVERSAEGGNFERIHSRGAYAGTGVRNYTDSELSAGTRYSYKVIAHKDLGGDSESNIASTETPSYEILLYATRETDGLSIYEAINPEDLELIGEYSTDENVNFAYVKVVDEYAYVYTYNPTGLMIIDVSDPSQPSQTGFVEAPAGAGMPAVSGDYAYIFPESGLNVIDVSDKENPRIAGEWGFERNGEVRVSGNYAYCAVTTGLYIIDVSNPGNPDQSGFASLQATGYVGLLGNYAYVGKTNGIWTIDISNPQNPNQVDELNNLGGGVIPVDFHFYNNHLITGSSGANFLVTYSLNNPAHPELVGRSDEDDRAQRVYDAVNGRAYVKVREANTFAIYDISSPANPRLLSINRQIGRLSSISVVDYR